MDRIIIFFIIFFLLSKLLRLLKGEEDKKKKPPAPIPHRPSQYPPPYRPPASPRPSQTPTSTRPEATKEPGREKPQPSISPAQQDALLILQQWERRAATQTQAQGKSASPTQIPGGLPKKEESFRYREEIATQRREKIEAQSYLEKEKPSASIPLARPGEMAISESPLASATAKEEIPGEYTGEAISFSFLRSLSSFQEGIILAEILGPPVSRRRMARMAMARPIFPKRP